jgi:hypothetical protein
MSAQADNTEHTDSLECEWCSAWVPPLTRNVDGRGFTYPRDEQGDVTCEFCLQLPAYHVRMGHA